MQDESKHDEPVDGYTERLVVLQLLGRGRGQPPARVRAALSDIDASAVDDAIESLIAAGVIDRKRTRLHPSPPTRRLDELCMICI
jgi:hypothetical protein